MIRRSGVILFVVIISLAMVWPVAAARRVKIDVVLLADTSDSMSDELEALCRALEDVVADLDRQGIDVNASVLGIAETRDCAKRRVTRLVPQGEVQSKEDWGPAVTDLARHYEWAEGAARLIIPLSDEGPLRGDPVSGDDEAAIQTAIRAAQASEVVVSPVLGTDFNAAVEPLARDLAQETGGRVFKSKDPDDDLAGGLRDLIRAAADRSRASATLLDAIPTPRDIVLDSQVISANLVLAVMLTLVLGVASLILEDVLGADHSIVDAGGPRWLTALVRLGQFVERVLAPGEWSQLAAGGRRLLATGQLALFLILMALLGLFLQPGLNPISWRGLALGLGLMLALLLVNLIYDGGQYVAARRAGATPVVRLRPGAPLATLISVLLSRVFGFLPGFLYGRVTYCTIAPETADIPEHPPGDSFLETEEDREESPRPVRAQRLPEAHVVLAGLAALSAAGLSLWGLTVPTSLLVEFIEDLNLPTVLGDVLTGGLGVFQGFFSLSFFLACQLLFFELLPFRPTGGDLLYRRHRLVWALAAFGVLFVLLHALINPFGTASEFLENGGLILLLLSSLVYSAVAVGVWLFTALRADGDLAPGRDQDQRITVLAISLIVIWILGACWGLVILVGGWLG